MRISFDLDDTLICYDPAVPCEPKCGPFWLRPWCTEPLRLGTKELMAELSRRGCEIWIYTTSYRSPAQVKWWLRFYGIKIASVVNQEMHDQLVRGNPAMRYVSKYPPAFGIDLHIDDLEGVKMEGDEHGFRVVVVGLTDSDWTRRVLDAIEQGNP
jgi:hypothetical protein